MKLCAMCSAGLPSSCLGQSCGQDLKDTTPVETHSRTQLPIETTNDVDEGRYNGRGSSRDSDSRSRGRSRRTASDSQSSGRKDAARLYPLDPNGACEWQGKADCGGGSYPILGCPTGVESYQQARHHGPEKNVQNNEAGNVHRICHYCHNRWHAKNDPTYDWNAGVWPPHDPRPLTETEQTKQVIDFMRYLNSGKRQKVLD